MLYRLLYTQSVARAIMYNVSGRVALILWCFEIQSARLIVNIRALFYRLSGNIFADDSINASVLESEEP